MSTLSKEQLLGALHWRYATKKYDADKKIPEETWRALEDAVHLAPSSYGLQPWKALVVKNSDASNDDASWYTTTSAVQFNAVAGQTYRFVVDGYNGASGNIQLNMS